MSDDFDTDAAGILIGNDYDVPTALAASYRPPASIDEPQPAKYSSFGLGLIVGAVLFVLWLLW